MYVHAEAPSTDAFVARVWGRPVDESLSGAAGAIALQLLREPSLDPADLRWKAILAGYPWPIARAQTQRVGEDEVPTEVLAVADASGAADLGLVRARGSSGDQWVLLVGGRRGELPAFTREPNLGSRLDFAPYRVRAATPSGEIRQSEGSLLVDAVGEWLVELSDDQGVAATFPLYAGHTTPQAQPFDGAASGEDAGDLDEELLTRMDTLDGWYRRAPAEREPLLDGLARARLRAFTAGLALPDPARQLAAVGFREGRISTCRAATVADCLDVMWWSIEGHSALGGAWGTVGFAVQAVPEGVAIAVASGDRVDNRVALP